MRQFLAASAVVAALLAAPSQAQQVTQPASNVDILDVDRDRYGRMTVPVWIGEHGPFDFLIDTGSERTVLARGLATRLGLVPSGSAVLVGMAGTLLAQLVDVAELRLGRRSFYSLSAPLLEGQHIGADGIIGLDGLRNQRVLIDFKRNLIAVDDAKVLGGNRGFEVIVRARPRSEQLVITNGLVDGVKTIVVLDTGANNSVGNRALQRQLITRRKGVPIVLSSATGQQVSADVLYVRRVRIGALDLLDLPLAIVDAPAFERLGLADKPTLMIGMDQLRAFNRVAIDFSTRRVLFDLPPEAVSGSPRAD